MSSDKYASEAKSATSSGRYFEFGFMMTYVRDTNYQMYMIDCVSRWWCGNIPRVRLQTDLVVLVNVLNRLLAMQVSAEASRGWVVKLWWAQRTRHGGRDRIWNARRFHRAKPSGPENEIQVD
jgi:hypothetical protein